MSPAAQAPSELVIIDPGYEHPHAHHQGVNLSIARALADHDIDTTIIAARGLASDSISALNTEGLQYRAYFETPCYPPDAECLEPRAHEALQQAFAEELIRLYRRSLLSGRESLLVHTAFSFHYHGLARALWHLRRDLQAPVLICPMFNPGAGPGPGKDTIQVHDPRSFVRHRLAWRLLEELKRRHGLDIRVGTSCRSYQCVFREIWKTGSVSIHPAISYREPAADAAAGGEKRPRVLLYAGGVKSSKGFEFAAALGAEAAGAWPGLRFVLHFNDAFPGAEHFAKHLEPLEFAGQAHGNVEIIRGNLSAEAYDQLLRSCHAVMILYDPEHYRHKSSGVFWDALRFEGRHWIVTDDTWARAELGELGIEHETVRFGDVGSGVRAVGAVAERLADPSSRVAPPARNRSYYGLLMRPFGKWVAEHLVRQQAHGPVPGHGRERPSVLVVRTNYGHFSDLSGPGGFVPYLHEIGLDVDEIKVDLGADRVRDVPEQTTGQFARMTHGFLSSFQLNSVPVEAAIQRNAHHYDIIHFVDAEHCGLLTALLRREFRALGGPALVATFHQPGDVMEQLVSDPSWLAGFDRIHLMAPDQARFFGRFLDARRLAVAPHGIAERLLEIGQTREASAASPADDTSGHLPEFPGRYVLLTVGNWLRDFDHLLATARLLEDRADIHFVIVSRNLALDVSGLDNVTLLNQGISDGALHDLYRRADLLFLPLKSGAANNAVLEAMAFGLPIVTTRIPAIDYYCGDLADTAPPEPAAYARQVKTALERLANSQTRRARSAALKARARELGWSSVARLLWERLYSPVLEPTQRRDDAAATAPESGLSNHG